MWIIILVKFNNMVLIRVSIYFCCLLVKKLFFISGVWIIDGGNFVGIVIIVLLDWWYCLI